MRTYILTSFFSLIFVFIATAQQCDLCNGGGEIDCHVCEGTRTYKDSKTPCHNCRFGYTKSEASGKEKCWKCQGTGDLKYYNKTNNPNYSLTQTFNLFKDAQNIANQIERGRRLCFKIQKAEYADKRAIDDKVELLDSLSANYFAEIRTYFPKRTRHQVLPEDSYELQPPKKTSYRYLTNVTHPRRRTTIEIICNPFKTYKKQNYEATISLLNKTSGERRIIEAQGIVDDFNLFANDLVYPIKTFLSVTFYAKKFKAGEEYFIEKVIIDNKEFNINQTINILSKNDFLEYVGCPRSSRCYRDNNNMVLRAYNDWRTSLYYGYIVEDFSEKHK
ncbi:hypothetical protein ACFFU1_12470 [Algibacter miyuki]|uniref:Uncharacterized protein n=1 Tax=Algibacter miyuki TaxID=1306933 RepID=A0ABV5H1Q7_9FLAO|nr:hypothetical protein [Algibacter miyuki]MDN3666330.1 hypothetical protein [Algibacter miyuki]